MTNEKLFESKIKRWLNSVGVYAAGTPEHKINKPYRGWFIKVWGGGMQKAGIPDLLLCVNGFFIAVEIKSKFGKLSTLQKINLSKINWSNGIAIVLYPDGFIDFQSIINEVLKCDTRTVGLNRIPIVHLSTNCVIPMTY